MPKGLVLWASHMTNGAEHLSSASARLMARAEHELQDMGEVVRAQGFIQVSGLAQRIRARKNGRGSLTAHATTKNARGTPRLHSSFVPAAGRVRGPSITSNASSQPTVVCFRASHAMEGVDGKNC